MIIQWSGNTKTEKKCYTTAGNTDHCLPGKYESWLCLTFKCSQIPPEWCKRLPDLREVEHTHIHTFGTPHRKAPVWNQPRTTAPPCLLTLYILLSARRDIRFHRSCIHLRHLTNAYTYTHTRWGHVHSAAFFSLLFLYKVVTTCGTRLLIKTVLLHLSGGKIGEVLV